MNNENDVPLAYFAVALPVSLPVFGNGRAHAVTTTTSCAYVTHAEHELLLTTVLVTVLILSFMADLRHTVGAFVIQYH